MSLYDFLVLQFAMNMRARDQITKRREQGDNNMMLFIFPSLYLSGSSRGHASRLSSEGDVREFLEGHAKNCRHI